MLIVRGGDNNKTSDATVTVGNLGIAGIEDFALVHNTRGGGESRDSNIFMNHQYL